MHGQTHIKCGFHSLLHENTGSSIANRPQAHVKSNVLAFPHVQADQKSLSTWWLYCNRQVHRDFLITLYML